MFHKQAFTSCQTTSDMRWNNEGYNKVGLLRHLVDSMAWRNFKSQYPQFASDSRNVWLGLASNGFNSFRTMRPT